jgi:hypothetical protein
MRKSKTKSKSNTTIRDYSTALVKGFIGQAQSISAMQHNLTKGQLRELFVANILKPFLSSQFGVGTGIIVNQKGEESQQTDIVIYDTRIIPPFIKEQNIGVYPAESVIAAIEVKSRLTKNEVESAEIAARKLHDVIFNSSSGIYKEFNFKPLSGIIGFFGSGVKELKDPEKGKGWLTNKVSKMFGICLIGKYAWINTSDKGWLFHEKNGQTHEETKAFICVLLDNVRTESIRRVTAFEKFHKDWLSIYLRHQNLF